jgi:hypothetical protein
MSSYKANSIHSTVSAPKKKGRPTGTTTLQEPQTQPLPKPKIDLSHFDFTVDDLAENMGDPVWRMSHLYKIVDKKKRVITFKPNVAQIKLLRNFHTRNVILKARKMGFSTFIQIFMLDTALFSPNESCVVIAQDREIAEAIFRDVFKFAYDNLPEIFKLAEPTSLEGTASKSSIAFKNSSRVEVRTSARGTTPTFLHISEFGKIAAKDPGKAREIITGSITAVPEDGLIFVESTAEGQEGEFFNLVQTARNMQDSGEELWKLDFKFHFFGWWEDPAYVMPPGTVIISARDEHYFIDLEIKIGRELTASQRAWYVKYRDVTYSGDQELMWAEMPSTPDEAFAVSMEGAYFKDQFSQIRKDKRIGLCPYDPMFPVSVFCDIGQGDEMAMWFIQPRRTYYAVINYIEASGEPFSYFVREADKLNYTLEYVYLPHDANHRRQGQDRNLTPEEMFQSAAPHWRFWLVPKTPDKIMAIQQGRIMLTQCVFDQKHCELGIKRLEAYRKTWDPRLGRWRETPRHGPESNGADAFLQAAQAKAAGFFSAVGGQGGPFGNEFGDSFFEVPNLGF